ncbi:CHAT domain-containing protein [Aestuariibacter halophilus]|uniref:CHAT domain-containing protein n=1 Tax=Fluctibacter halophilus TaxID=226011 RepID=A0ABS8G9E3_9ALTE|nr:CHAT domain-containing tetratricopeptide repeat protein [Aestuariibacter halophilus]MCC2617187.1 CHAT domain-containing protein [Aestuariibacter halophilus]
MKYANKETLRVFTALFGVLLSCASARLWATPVSLLVATDEVVIVSRPSDQSTLLLTVGETIHPPIALGGWGPIEHIIALPESSHPRTITVALASQTGELQARTQKMPADVRAALRQFNQSIALPSPQSLSNPAPTATLSPLLETPQTARYVSTQLLLQAIAQPQNADIAEHLSRFNTHAEASVASIALYCQVLGGWDAEGDTASFAYWSARARLSESLVEVYRQNGSLAPIAAADYHRWCDNVVTSWPDDATPTNRDINAIEDATRLLDAMTRESAQLAPRIQATVLQGRWFLANYQGRYQQAENLARQAIALLAELPDQHEPLATLYSMISSTLVRRGHYAEAHRYLSQALAMSASLRPQTISLLQFNKGFFYRELGELDAARMFMHASLSQLAPAFAATDLTNDAANCPQTTTYQHRVQRRLIQIAATFRLQQDYSRAQQWLDCAAIQTPPKRSGPIAPLHLARARLYLALQQPEQALPLLTALLQQSHHSEPVKRDALLLTVEAKLALRQPLEGTLSAVAQTFGIASFYTDAPLQTGNTRYYHHQLDALRLLILHHQGTDADDRRWQTHFAQQAIELLQQQQTRISNPFAYRQVQKRVMDAWISAQRLSHHGADNVSLVHMWQTLEAFQDLDLASESNLYRAAFNNEQQRNALQQRYQRWLALERQYVTAADEVRAQLVEPLETAKRAFLDFNYLNQRTPESPPEPLQLKQIQQRLAPGDMLVRYFIGDNNQLGIVITASDINTFSLGPAPSLAPLIERFRHDLVKNNEWLSSALILRQTLLPDTILNRSNLRRLYIVADGILEQVPFAALNGASTKGSYTPLVERMSVINLSSSRALMRGEMPTALQGTMNDINVAVFANPAFADKNGSNVPALRQAKDLRALPGSALEARHVSATFAPQQLSLGQQAQATRQFLLADDTRHRDILHIATHGYFDPAHPEVVGLLTAPSDISAPGSDFLSLSELLSVPVANQLVVLSGCDTMQGKLFNGSGLRSMTRGFLAQGAHRVIGTLWPVHDLASAALMKGFYTHLQQHGDVALALQQSQLAMSRGGRYRHPRYWAAFVLTQGSLAYQPALQNETAQVFVVDQ